MSRDGRQAEVSAEVLANTHPVEAILDVGRGHAHGEGVQQAAPLVGRRMDSGRQLNLDAPEPLAAQEPRGRGRLEVAVAAPRVDDQS
eukprot:2940635-Pyramimonas_sp.AAC.1